MRYAAAFPFVAASLIASVVFPECASAQTNQYANDRLFLEESDDTPLYKILSFNSVTAVENYYGAVSQQSSLAQEFFANCDGCGANMLFTRFPDEPARAHLYGANISSMTLAQLQTIKGSLKITSQGYDLSGGVSLSGVSSFAEAGVRITNALNKHLPIEAGTTSSIAAASVSFTGSIDSNILTVAAVSSGSIQIGSAINGHSVSPGEQVSAQLSGTPGGPGQYLLFLHGLAKNYAPVPAEAMTETYGILTVGSESSGAVAVGQQVTGQGVPPLTAIEANLSGSGPGSTWVINNVQATASEEMQMTAAPVLVRYKSVKGDTGNNDFFFLQQNQNFLYTSSSLSYMTGMAAGTLGLSKTSGAFDSTPGALIEPSCPSGASGCISVAAFMNEVVIDNGWGSDQWHTFQNADFLAPPPGIEAALAAWAQSAGGQYDFLANYTNSTPPIVGSSQLPFAGGAAAPEPSSWVLALLGFAGLGLARYRYRLGPRLA